MTTDLPPAGTDSGLIHALVLDGRGRAEGTDMAGVRAWKPADGPLWIHLDRTADDARAWLRAESGLESDVCDALLADETRPRTQVLGDGAVVILRGVNLNPGAEPDDMISVRMWIDAGRVISLRYPRLVAIEDVRQDLAAGRGPGTPGELLVSIAQHLGERMAPVLANLDDIVDSLEEQGVDTPGQGLRRQLGQMRRQAITLRRYIAPQRDAIARLAASPVASVAWLSERDRARLREAQDRTTRYVEDLDALRERAAIVQEELAGRLAEQMNRTMYVLSLVAGIFLPLGLLTGLLGINVGGMPGVDSDWAFTIVCLILLVLAGIGTWLFRRLRFF